MKRLFIAALLPVLALARAEEPAKVMLQARLHPGERLAGSNSIGFEMKMSERQADREKTTFESVQRTERFVQTVQKTPETGSLEIERTYLSLYARVKSGNAERPTVFQSPVTGRTVLLKETRRRREVALKGHGALDAHVQRTAGMEIDWRDILSDDPVGPGDTWSGDSAALSKRLAAYLNCGSSRTEMKVRYEEDAVRQSLRCAHLYVDWTVEGMRDLHLFTKVTLSGDAWFDLEGQRFLEIDLAGKMIIQGAIAGKGPATIIRGEGPVTLKSGLKAAPLEAAVEDEE